MLAMSPGASMAWQLAASEAARSQQRYIECESVFVGICRLGPWLRQTVQGQEQRQLTPQALRAIQPEVETIEELLRTVHLTPQIVCRAVRTAAGHGTHSHGTASVVHRSQACKTCFQRANALATAAHAQEIHCLHLLSALLEHPGPILSGVFGVFRVDPRALHAQVVAITYALDALHVRAQNKGQGVSHLIYVGREAEQ